GIERQHLNGRIIDLRQRRDRQQPVRHRAHQQNGDHQQDGRHRPQNKWPGQVHPGSFSPLAVFADGFFFPPVSGSRGTTCVPCVSLSRPSVTTISPGSRPLSTEVLFPSVGPVTISRRSTVESAFTT